MFLYLLWYECSLNVSLCLLWYECSLNVYLCLLWYECSLNVYLYLLWYECSLNVCLYLLWYECSLNVSLCLLGLTELVEKTLETIELLKQERSWDGNYTPTRREGAILQAPCPFVRPFTLL